MTHADLLQKIRKCLALAKSANEHEAAAALAKARELMDAYGVTDSEVSFLDIGEESARGSRCQRPPKWESILNNAVCRAIGCTSFIDADLNRRFVGRTPAAEIAAYAFLVLFRKLRAARTEYISTQLRRCKPARKRARADSFCEGWASAVFRKIADLVPPKEDDELVGRYLSELHPDLRTINSRAANINARSAWDDYSRGHERGRNIELNQAVNGTSPMMLES